MSDIDQMREYLLDTLSRVAQFSVKEAPSLVVICPNPMNERQHAALSRAFEEGLIKLPLLRATAEINEQGENDEIILRFEPEEIRVVIDPSG